MLTGGLLADIFVEDRVSCPHDLAVYRRPVVPLLFRSPLESLGQFEGFNLYSLDDGLPE